ncbi:MAG: FeoC-like transcriptional regulator [Legionellales bacterium]|nr:FeoC-like transcriptional regulator [Legionellales bacterium]
MLLQIRDFIVREKVVSTQQLAREFQVDEEALQPMLEIWVKRGVIRKCQEEVACQSGCFRCKIGTPVFYQHGSGAK